MHLGYGNPKWTHVFNLQTVPKIKISSLCLDLESIGSFDEFLKYPFEFSN